MDGKQSQADPQTYVCMEHGGTGQLVTAAPQCLGYDVDCMFFLTSVIWGQKRGLK